MMKLLCKFLIVGICGYPLMASARDDQLTFPIVQALNFGAALGKLDPGVKLFFGKQRHPRIAKDLGEWSTSKKTNAFAKTDQQACEWAFLSAVIALQERARKEGANAVVNISSNYKNFERSSESEYVCGAGGLIAGVAFKGRAVLLGN
jgi:uncharacterized protein YbjQ (UPF0145 family)